MGLLVGLMILKVVGGYGIASHILGVLLNGWGVESSWELWLSCGWNCREARLYREGCTCIWL